MTKLEKNADSIAIRYLEKLIEIYNKIGEFIALEHEIGDSESNAELITLIDDSKVKLLKSIMNKGLLRPNLFPLLLRANGPVALEYLIDRYLGRNIHYDNGLTGYTGTLKGFFSDIVDLHGSNYLHDFLRSSGVDQVKLRDKRVKEAIISSVHELDSIKDVNFWLKRE